MPDRSRRRQRGVVAAALALSLLAAALWPTTGGSGAARASAEQCGPEDANRWHFTLSSGAQIDPCMSKVNLRLSLGSGRPGAFTVSRIGVPSSDVTMRYADGSTESGLIHVTFSSFEIHDGATLATTNGDGYTLRLTPAAQATIGGDGVTTDLVITPDSELTVSVLGACITLKASLLASLSWLVNGTNWEGCKMAADVRFLATKGPAGLNSIALPDTSVKVGQ